MTQESAQSSNFEGWAVLEIFGHQRYAGHVSTQIFGTAVMFRIDVPALKERERLTKRPGYIEGTYAPAGTLIKEGEVQGYTKLFGVGAIYALTPCTQETAIKAVEEMQPRPMMILSIPTQPTTEKALSAGGDGAPFYSPVDDDAEDDDELEEADTL